MDVTTLLASAMTDDRVVCKASLVVALIVDEGRAVTELGGPGVGRIVCIVKKPDEVDMLVEEGNDDNDEVALMPSNVVPFASAQNLSAAVCKGSHSLQYFPTAQQSANCWLRR